MPIAGCIESGGELLSVTFNVITIRLLTSLLTVAALTTVPTAEVRGNHQVVVGSRLDDEDLTLALFISTPEIDALFRIRFAELRHEAAMGYVETSDILFGALQVNGLLAFLNSPSSLFLYSRTNRCQLPLVGKDDLVGTPAKGLFIHSGARGGYIYRSGPESFSSGFTGVHRLRDNADLCWLVDYSWADRTDVKTDWFSDAFLSPTQDIFRVGVQLIHRSDSTLSTVAAAAVLPRLTVPGFAGQLFLQWNLPVAPGWVFLSAQSPYFLDLTAEVPDDLLRVAGNIGEVSMGPVSIMGRVDYSVNGPPHPAVVFIPTQLNLISSVGITLGRIRLGVDVDREIEHDLHGIGHRVDRVSTSLKADMDACVMTCTASASAENGSSQRFTVSGKADWRNGRIGIAVEHVPGVSLGMKPSFLLRHRNRDANTFLAVETYIEGVTDDGFDLSWPSVTGKLTISAGFLLESEKPAGSLEVDRQAGHVDNGCHEGR